MAIGRASDKGARNRSTQIDMRVKTSDSKLARRLAIEANERHEGEDGARALVLSEEAY